MPFRFEELEIWAMARKLDDRIYRICASFPDVERYSLVSQLTRAANSVCLNIAEGSGRDTKADFNRFLGIAVGSACEVTAALLISRDRGYIDQAVYDDLYEQADHLARSIQRFRAALLAKRVPNGTK